MSYNEYRYLNTSDGENSTTSEDDNGATVYTIDVTEASTTLGVGLDGSPVTYELTGTGLTGSGTVKLEFSCDNGLTWTDAVDNDGNAISYTMSSSTLSEVVKDFQVIGNAQRWNIDGDNTDGDLTIKVVK